MGEPGPAEEVVQLLAATAIAAVPAAVALPSRTITIVVPTAAGGGNDAMARTIAQQLGPLLGQTVSADNRAGANGSIASEFVARATPDGHTLIFGCIATHAMNPALQKLRCDAVADFEPVGLVGTSPTLMVAHARAPFKDVKERVVQLKARPDRHSHASAGNVTAPHHAAELFKPDTGVVMLGVPYKGSAPAIGDTIGGQTQLMLPSFFTALSHVRAGKLEALAIAGPKRSLLLPDVPTLKEAVADGHDARQIGLGCVHASSRRSVVYATLSRIDNRVAATFAVPGGASGLAGGGHSCGVEFGMRHGF